MPHSNNTEPDPLLRAGLVIIPLTIAAGLWLDASGGPWARTLVNVWVWLLYAGLLWRIEPTQRRSLFACLLISTGGEILLTEGFASYTYASGFVPAYVPPGHCLLYYWGAALSRRITRERALYWAAGIVATCATALVWSEDQIGILSTIALGVLIWRGRARRLYAVMALSSLAMEILGTGLGVWTWAPKVLELPLTQNNPPLGVGILYCMLDAIVLRFGSPTPPEAGATPNAAA